MNFYDQTVEAVADAVKVDLERGLTAAEAGRRQQEQGKNELKIKVEPWWRKVIEPFLDVFMGVLALALAISLWHGDAIEAILIGAIMAINAVIYYVQRFSTERIVRGLKKQTIDYIAVFRNGKWAKVASPDLVVGDIVRFTEGEKIAADCRVIHEKSVLVDEAILTGESERVGKKARALEGDLEVYDQSNMLFSGTFVVGGEVVALVVRIGNDTQFGQIAALATGNQKHQSPVQTKINQLIKVIAIIVGVLSVLVLVMQLLRGASLVEATQFVLAMAVSAVPEGLPVAIAVILALGIQRMAKKRALVTNMRAIETIGAINIVATDKTGTLTENRLTVQDVWSLRPDRGFRKLYQALALSVVVDSPDPLDGAFLTSLSLAKVDLPKSTPALVFPFEQGMTMSGNLWHEGAGFRLMVKGAPEKMIGLADLNARETEDVEKQLLNWARQGYRVLAIAERKTTSKTKTLKAAAEGGGLKLVGLVAVADQIRRDAKAAIKTARAAGVRVCMITGDHAETALAVGRQVGLAESLAQVLDARGLEAMDDDELERALAKVGGQEITVFARVTPEQKYRLLLIFERSNITAMTGDGVNDVPALAQAHIGIAMGDSTPVVKDAADMILLDNNFKNIVEAMREGRAIVANIRRMLIYLLSTNAGEVLVIVGALLIGVPVPLAPLQILWINLVTDSCLVIPLGLEKPEKNIMEIKPLAFDAPLLSKGQVMRIVVAALWMATLALAVYFFFGYRYNYGVGATLAFQTLAVVQWARALSMRSFTEPFWKRAKVRSRPFVIGLIAAIIAQTLVFTTPLGAALSVNQVPLYALLSVSVVTFMLMLLVVEIQKKYSKI
ncbi:cation-transporting P-type ATPase [Candidatus Saccharibacteria bacterium]|nr:cation-transporting P-type ATPase [Candidatus Saccharibacteria bacterium]